MNKDDMKILVITQYFPPEMGAPQTRLYELGLQLQNLGWQVQVLTALPNYPTGKIYDEYAGNRVKRDNLGGLDVIRTSLIPSQSPKALPRMLCYLSFAWSALQSGKKFCERHDVIMVESPPLFLGLTAKKLAKRWNVPFVFNVSDLWPDSFVHMGRLKTSSFAYRLMKKMELAFYREAAGVTGQSGEIIDAIRKMVPGVNATLITNGVSCDRFGKNMADPEWRNKAGWENKCVFVFAGLHGLAQGLHQILSVALRLRDRTDILFAFIGDGPVKSDLQALATKEDLKNVQFYPPQKRDRIPFLLSSADVALITLGSAIHGAVPSKIYEAMASELPIVLVAEGEPAERVNAAAAGIVVNCNDLDGLGNAIIKLADNVELRKKFGVSGRQAAEQLYSREAIAIKLSDFLKKVISGECQSVNAK
jgi:glycosyltransferase involved in cell wall biosynthesis